ncbi:MAG TPA: tRNA lysidine(34) synthetase TilS, partial [Candidatus Glassbacteria bacterium]|nr:tRNA lysidine(34) synthetase TilS [Candidatus Glassbacteria bacterium]
PLIALDNLVNLGRSGARAILPGGVLAVKEFDRVRLQVSVPNGTSRPETSIELERDGVTLVEMAGECWRIEVLEESRRDMGMGSTTSGDAGARALEQSFDAAQLAFPLRVTGWRPGDRLRPFGLGGEKKLKKLFGEKKIALSCRSGIPVIRDADGKILWVCGVSRSDCAPLGSRTRRIVRLKATKIAAGRKKVSSQGVIDTQIR